MGWFTRTFGNVGTVRFEGMSIDGRLFTGKTQIESFGLTKEEIEEKLKQMMYVEKGIKCSTLKITGYVGS
jgi:hypothetical protein